MAAGGRYEFGHYRLDVRAHLLFRNGRRVVLTPKAVDLLAALVEAQGEPVGKQELLHRVWPDAVVEEGSLTSHISLLRRVLAEGAGGRQLIRVSDATHLWAEGYERSLHDILALQAEVARAIAREIQIKLTVGVQHRLDRVAAIDPEAHEAYLRGRHLWNRRTEEGLRNSI